MSIRDILLHETVTTPAVLGGTTHQFGADGAQVSNGIHLVDISEANYLDRFQITIKNRPTVLNAKTGSLSKEKRSISIARPYVPEVNGQLVPAGLNFSSARLEIECHPNAMNDVPKFRAMLVDLLQSSSVDAFFDRGDLS